MTDKERIESIERKRLFEIGSRQEFIYTDDMQSEMGWDKPTDANNLYEELIHVAAVSVAIDEQIKELEN